MIIETDRLLLRPWAESDAEALYEYAKDPRVGPDAGWKEHTSIQNSREIIRTVLSLEGTFAITLKGEGVPIGSIGFFRPTECGGDGDLEIGYWIGVPFWGKGYVPEAVKELMRICFEERGCPKVWCAHYMGNDKSRRVIEKCGFRREYLREVSVPMMGERRIEVFYSMLRAEWNAKYGKSA